MQKRLALVVIICLSISGCSGQQASVDKMSQQTGDFDSLVETASQVADTISDTHSSEGHTFTLEVMGGYPDKEETLIACDDRSASDVSTHFALVKWKKVDGVWRFDSMKSGWDDFGMLSIIIEQQIVNKLCRALDDQFKPPRSDPKKSEETAEALMKLIEMSKPKEN
ncbi:hypothetical protein [uncultured Gimesia sp.]|jgi:hypothetical protein|uniref:hypothetical protein n=1 Tax=uncultured Gimesia sp. TaxID=1678688 RepID=UPI002609B979|nr:hypothetical protein [uncultured Gimesia sp.]